MSDRNNMTTWTRDTLHNAGWNRYMDAERTQLAQRATGQLRRAIGHQPEEEAQEELERIAAEDERQAKEGMVPLRKDGRVYYKHIDDLTREDRWARLEAEQVTLMWIKGRIEGAKIAREWHEKGWDQPDT